MKFSNTTPATCMADMVVQCNSGEARYGAITPPDDLKANIVGNCLLEDLAAYQP